MTVPAHVVAELSRANLSRHHPVRRVNAAVRTWLAFVVVLMLWNSVVANGIVLESWLRPVPFLAVAVTAVVWLCNAWSATATAWCCGIITMGVLLRAVELVGFGRDDYELRALLTGASVWTFVAVTTLVVGFVNVVIISRRTADIEVWGPLR